MPNMFAFLLLQMMFLIQQIYFGISSPVFDSSASASALDVEENKLEKEKKVPSCSSQDNVSLASSNLGRDKRGLLDQLLLASGLNSHSSHSNTESVSFPLKENDFYKFLCFDPCTKEYGNGWALRCKAKNKFTDGIKNAAASICPSLADAIDATTCISLRTPFTTQTGGLTFYGCLLAIKKASNTVTGVCCQSGTRTCKGCRPLPKHFSSDPDSDSIKIEKRDLSSFPPIDENWIAKFCNDPFKEQRGKDYELRCAKKLPKGLDLKKFCPAAQKAALNTACLQIPGQAGGFSTQLCLTALFKNKDNVVAFCCKQNSNGCLKEGFANCTKLRV